MSIRIKNYSDYVALIEALPVGTYYSVKCDGELSMQANGEEVKAVRACFPGQIWEKIPPLSKGNPCDWWNYITTLPSGIKMKIYADFRGPLSCERIEETVTRMEEVEVPVTTRKEMREITKKVVRWKCPEAEAEGA